MQRNRIALALAGLMAVQLTMAGMPVRLAAPAGQDIRVAELSGAFGTSINAQRQSAGRGTVRSSPVLDEVAAQHARDMARNGNRSHTGSDGSKLGTRLKGAGYRACWAGENIAWGTGDGTQVMKMWMGSRQHRNNILNRKAREFGIASQGAEAWVLVMAAPC